MKKRGTYLLRINDELMQLCKWLNERRDVEIRLDSYR
jgi:hypothetical protein